MKKMRHMSTLLQEEDHEAFRSLCYKQFDMSPSAKLRNMVRSLLGRNQHEHIKKESGNESY